MAKIDNLDEVVELITQRVADKLQQMGMGQLNGGTGTGDICGSTSKHDCSGCGGCAVKKHNSVNNLIKYGATRFSANPKTVRNIDQKLASMIDHTLLKPDATREELIHVCEEAKEYNFATVCVNSSNVGLVARHLKGSPVKPIAVVGFPLGAGTTQAKIFETREAVRAGAKEIDMVINTGALKSKDYETVYNDIKGVVEASKPFGVKVILENSGLNDDEKIIACALSKTAGAAFVKTSTGFGKGGATIPDVELMRRIVGEDMEVKASGGIRNTADAKAMVNAGANRIGASAGIAIVTGKKAKAGNY